MAEEVDNEKLHLDLRMEEIRLKNEELEKKHKEILEDEMNAKRENAVVNLKSCKYQINRDEVTQTVKTSR